MSAIQSIIVYRLSLMEMRYEIKERAAPARSTGFRSPSLRLLALLMVLSCLPARVVGQGGETGTITGNIFDPTGAVVPGAAITLMNAATGTQKSTTANEKGNYVFPFLVPGTYEVAVTSSGFKSITKKGILLGVAQTARVDFTMELGAVSEQVAVASTGPLLQTDSGAVGTTIVQDSVVSLPLNGRDFTQLATLTPGVTPGATNAFAQTSNLKSNGLRDSKTLFTLGGASISDEHFSGAVLLPSPDAIQEFKLQTNNMSAEYGAGGAVVNVELKSGTNRLRGNVYEFLRNDALDARNYFASTKGILRRNQFGFTVGGPIIKNRTFFFADYDGSRIHQGSTFNSVVPTAAMRTGDFSGLKVITDPQTGNPFLNNQIPANRLSSAATYFLQFIPAPNTPGGTYVRNGNQVTNTNQFDLRLDHNLRISDTLDGSYSLRKLHLDIPGAFPENGGRTQRFQSQLATLREIHTFNPALVNEARGSYYRETGYTVPQGLGTNFTTQSGIAGFDETSALFPGFPGLTISGFQGIDGGPFTPLLNIQNMSWFTDIITWVKGNHAVKAGASFRWYRFNASNSDYSRGSFTFAGTYTGNALADYLLGIPRSAVRSFPHDEFGALNRNQYFFIQDDWRVTSTLTLNLGLRYELNWPRAVLNHAGSSYNPFSNQLIISSDSNGNINTKAQLDAQYTLPAYADIIVPSSKAGIPSSLQYLNKLNFAPRFGFAWQPGGGVVLKGGYGIFYGQEEGNRQGSVKIDNIPYTVRQSLVNTATNPATLANMFGTITPATFQTTPAAFFTVDPHSPIPYVQEWNFAVEKILGKGLVLDGAYVANKGTDIEFSSPLNIPLPGPGSVQARRPLPRFAAGSYVSNNSNSSYNSFQATIKSRAWHRLTLLGAYTWSKSIDYVSIDPHESLVQDPNNIPAERGVSDYNIPNRFTLSATYDVPVFKSRADLVGRLFGGWQVSNIVTLQSGLPFTPSVSSDPANTGTSKRPNRIGSGNLSDPTINRWFDVSAFVPPATFTYGNSRRNILEDPPFKNWDFGLFKNFSLERLRGGSALQFRSEFFNFLNHPNFGSPVTDIQSPAAGKILSAASPRDIQFGLKLSF